MEGIGGWGERVEVRGSRRGFHKKLKKGGRVLQRWAGGQKVARHEKYGAEKKKA